SLHTPRFLRRLHRYYGPVRLPASARHSTMVTPCAVPPSADSPMDPAGSPRFRERPFVHETVHDPGGASPSRVATVHITPSTKGPVSASTTFILSGLNTRTLHNPCLRFGPRVAATPARLGSGLSAMTLAGRDFHPHVSFSFAWRTPPEC